MGGDQMRGGSNYRPPTSTRSTFDTDAVLLEFTSESFSNKYQHFKPKKIHFYHQN